jgi:hypothetical protein
VTHVPWARDRRARARIEQRVAELEGNAFVGVRYFVLLLAGEEAWDAQRDFDSLEIGLELDLDDGSTWSAAWLQAGANDGVLLVPGGLDLLGGGGVWQCDVSARSRWSRVLGQRIERTDVMWDRRYEEEPQTGVSVVRSEWCARGVALVFASGERFVILLGLPGVDGTLQPASDHLVVISDAATARRLGVERDQWAAPDD